MSEIWIATGNKGKLSEYRILFEKHLPGWTVKSNSDLPVFSAPPENGTTFLENARIKARSVSAMKSQYWVLGEDAGLEVTGLGGLPGIHSARYAGPKASDSENTAKLLKMMQIKGVTDRSARFRACIVAKSPLGQEHHFEGVLEGQIAKAPRGQLGFGYDPVFIPNGQDKTLAELGSGFKAQHSHRALACRSFIELLIVNSSATK